MGRVGVITYRERHMGGFDIVHVKDSLERTFATRYVLFLLGKDYFFIWTFSSVSVTFSSSVKATSHGSLYQKAKVPSLPSPRKEISEDVVSLPQLNSRSWIMIDFNLYLVYASCPLYAPTFTYPK